jgi:hypothetical protein
MRSAGPTGSTKAATMRRTGGRNKSGAIRSASGADGLGLSWRCGPCEAKSAGNLDADADALSAAHYRPR